VLCRFAKEDAVPRADVDHEHLTIDASNLYVDSRHSARKPLEADAAKAAALGDRVERIPADHAVSVDVNSRIILENKVSERPGDPHCGCGRPDHAVLGWTRAASMPARIVRLMA
jgi:hypothetical protein